MRKSVLTIIVAVIALVAVIGIVIANRADVDAPSPISSQEISPSSQANQTDTGESRTQEDDTNRQQSPTSASVEIVNMAFSPASITVKKGTTVTWTNKDSDRHDVTPDQPGADFQKSDLLARGKTYEWTFNTTGTYAYHCSPHPHMKGTVIVTD